MANVLITGCSSGFGLLTARQFARKGDTVFATMRNTKKAGSLEQARNAEKLDNIKILQLDVLDDASVKKAVAEASKAGPIDVLVNNAGLELRSSIEDATDAEVKRQFETNVFGTLRVIRAVLPAMRERGSGTIVNLSSIAGVVAPPYGGFYAASKHALEAISEALHYEVQPLGVRVIVIEPGGFATEFRNNIQPAAAFNDKSPYWERAERFETAVRGITAPGGQSGDPEDVAIAIYNAVHDAEPKLRYLVGGDAQMIAGVRKQTTFEQFEAAMRQTMNWHD
jgi:NAD(P)-dependent dehydrogenase (short-subunit alcohol dehydrogenase family)